MRGNINLTCLRQTSIDIAGVNVQVYFWVGVVDVVSDVGVEPVSSREERSIVSLIFEELVPLVAKFLP